MQSSTGLNSEFSFSKTGYHTKAKESSLPYYLHIIKGRLVWCVPFPRVLALSEVETDSSRIWTQVIMSISYGNIY